MVLNAFFFLFLDFLCVCCFVLCGLLLQVSGFGFVYEGLFRARVCQWVSGLGFAG